MGDEAVGKGGRKTPSRLTPDPYMKGQIKDHSKEPQGGASGGGKESGEGGEGLEGPAPRDHGQRDWNGWPASRPPCGTRPKGVDLQFQVTGYHHTDLEKMIDVMAQIEPISKRAATRTLLRRAEGAGRRAGQRQAVPQGRVRGPQGRHGEPARPTSRRTSSAACRTPRRPVGRISTAILRAPRPRRRTASAASAGRPSMSQPCAARRVQLHIDNCLGNYIAGQPESFTVLSP